EQLTEKDYLLLLLGIYIKHKLSDVVLRDMIAMINFICGSNILPETLFKLFAPLKTYDSFEMHFYCAKCRNTHTSEDNRDTKMVCCDTICTNYFITFDMKEKIEKFLTVNASNIKCTRSNDNIIRDIFDGVTYKNDKITKISRIFPLYCVADAPAKAKILNFINHSGYYSCNYCEIHGIYESNAVRFPYGSTIGLRNFNLYKFL
ncbi:hypothetical protein Avbf_16038, partial [Armadillidium vulgare]